MIGDFFARLRCRAFGHNWVSSPLWLPEKGTFCGCCGKPREKTSRGHLIDTIRWNTHEWGENAECIHCGVYMEERLAETRCHPNRRTS